MERSIRQWPAWLDDVLDFEPIRELGPEWQAAIGDAVVEMLDLRARGAEVRVCPCCGVPKIRPEEA
jgi:hypothetical protein